MINRKSLLGYLAGSLVVLSIFYLIRISNNEGDFNQLKEIAWLSKSDEDYVGKCVNLYRKISEPNASLFFKPPLQRPPPEMYEQFTQHGDMPITKYWYFNDAYSDSTNDQKSIKKVITKSEIHEYLTKVRENKPLNYEDTVLNELMHYFAPSIRGKSTVVIGTILPWIEAIALDIGSSKIVTLDYTHNSYEMPELVWMHVGDYLKNAIRTKQLEQFDIAVSFSSLEHAGLGRYGDPLNPNGDIEAVRQIHCMLKPGGLFFLALPTSKDGSSYIEFNAHRVYGTKRLYLLFKGWRLLLQKLESTGFHTIFVLEKLITKD